MKNKITRIIFYDLETTGVDPKNDEIIEIGAKDNLGNVFDKLINPNREVSQKITELTGISNEKLKYRNNMERSYEKINEWFDFEKKNKNVETYLIAHNGDNFDYKFLSKHFKIKCKSIDTLTLFRKLLPYRPSHSIKSLCELYEIDCSKHHRALEDVIILEKLFNKAVKLYCVVNNVNDINDVNIDEIYNYTYNT